MRFEVTVRTQFAFGAFLIEAPTIPQAFALMSTEAARRGLGLLNSGNLVQYSIRIVEP